MSLKPIASLSLDLDNQWSYMKTHGDPGWKVLPSYLAVVVPRFLELLDEYGWKITVFVVGQDAALPQHHGILKTIARAGHEIGNHSYNHEPWFHLYSPEQVETEIVDAENAIAQATGVRPKGYRGPGYSLSETVLQTLIRRSYTYDASTLPTFIGPLARLYYFASTTLDAEQSQQRAHLFGSFRDGLRPLEPYLWRLEGAHLLELPVTTLPWLRLPIHFSYILYLATYSKKTALAYLRGALAGCRAARINPSLLLHPLDFLSGSDVSSLNFFPAMEMALALKSEILREMFAIIDDSFEVVPLEEQARRLRVNAGQVLRELQWQGNP